MTGFGDDSSFGRLLQTSLQAKGWHGAVREISYGGLSVNALAGLIEKAASPVESGDLVGLEIATSFLSLQGYTLSDALPYVFSLTKYFVDRRDIKVFFLNLFRADLDDNDCVVQAVCLVSRYFNIPILDLKTPFRTCADKLAFGTTDGVHPDLKARQRVAFEIESFLESTEICTPENPGQPGLLYEYLDLTGRITGRELIHYEGRGKSLDGAVAMAGDELEIDLGSEANVVGLCFLYGPETGFVVVEIDDTGPIELITFDEFSFYRRVGFRPIERKGRLLKIQVLHKTRNVDLLRPTVLKVASRREFLCGVVIKNESCALPLALLRQPLVRGQEPPTNRSDSRSKFDSIAYWRARNDQYLFDPNAIGNAALDRLKNERIYSALDVYIANIITNLDGRKPFRVLDLGCGIAMLAGVFIRMGCEYTGVDISDTAVEIARAKYPNARFIVANIADLPLDEKFDIIIERTVFIHLVEDDYWSAIIEEIRRLLARDGVFILMDHLPVAHSEAPVRAEHVKFRLYGEYAEAFKKSNIRFDLPLRDRLESKVKLSLHTHFVTHTPEGLRVLGERLDQDLITESKAQQDAANKAKDEYVKFATERQAQIQQITLARNEETKRANDQKALLDATIKTRDEQAKLAADAQAQVQQLTAARDGETKRANDLKTHLEVASNTKDEQIKLAADLRTQLDAANKAKDEQTKLAGDLKAQLEAATQKVAEVESAMEVIQATNQELELRQRIQHEEMIKAEAQIDLIKDVLLREPGL